MHWKPKTTLETLQAKAELLTTIRRFFAEKNILEVQTPLMCQCSVTDPYIESIPTPYGFLQTSPEYAMKKLLAIHQKSIYQICKAFRDEEGGRWHAKEFTMLEWYIVHADLFTLMDQVAELITLIMPNIIIEKKSYRNIFLTHTSLDPFTCDAKQAYLYLQKKNKLPVGIDDSLELDDYLQIIMSEIIEPQFSKDNALLIYDYPKGQASLAKLVERDYGMVAERVELYINGIECGNGFHELQDPQEQLKRFKENQQKRQSLGLKHMDIDLEFVQALEYGLPECSGIAIGLDRILMLKNDIKHIQEINN